MENDGDGWFLKREIFGLCMQVHVVRVNLEKGRLDELGLEMGQGESEWVESKHGIRCRKNAYEMLMKTRRN